MVLNQKPGALALVGSGEYTPAMNETDRSLLETVGGPSAARVVIMATASGLEDPSSPARWTRMGLDHFQKLGTHVEAAEILQREDASDPHWLSLLEKANFYYFSGGSPQHLIETLRDTPAWRIIQQGWQNGAVLAGCSAGAMALGGYTASVRSVMRGDGPGWIPALGWLPGLITLPHFDRMAGYAGPEMFHQLLSHIPKETLLVGVDEDTALVRGINSVASNWQVLGRQSVSLFSSVGKATIYRKGEDVPLNKFLA
ncbi:MAG: Type 1 glutamine amidotransferase-like domain-containing protein [Chloroflexota bacterium]